MDSEGIRMKKAVILFVLGMVLVSMAPIAMSESPWTDRNGEDNPGSYESDASHEVQCGDGFQPDGQSQCGGGAPQNGQDG